MKIMKIEKFIIKFLKIKKRSNKLICKKRSA